MHADEVATAKSLALEVLAHRAPVNRLTMKQYRDAADMERACYQAAVLTERSLTRVYDIREIEQRVHVRINRVPGHPIVEALGLKVKSVDSNGGNVIDNLQPIRPFWMHVAVKEELGKTIGVVNIPAQQVDTRRERGHGTGATVAVYPPLVQAPGREGSDDARCGRRISWRRDAPASGCR